MKKILLLSLVLLLIFSACGSSSESESSTGTTNATTTVTIAHPDDSTTTAASTVASDTSSTQAQTTPPGTIPAPIRKAETNSENIIVKTYQELEIKVKYPEIKSLSNEINAMIYDAAVYLNQSMTMIPEDSVINGDCEVKYLSEKYVSIVFWGERVTDEPSEKFSFFWGINIDLNTGNALKQSDVVYTEEPFLNAAREAGKKQIWQDQNIDYYGVYIADKASENLLHNNFYLTENALGIGVGTAQSFHEFEIPYENLGGILKIKLPE